MNSKLFSLLFITALLFGGLLFAQDSRMGVGTSTPTVTLEVVSDPANLSLKDAVKFPILTGAELAAKESAYTAANAGTIVVVTSAAPDLLNPVFTNVNDIGIYQYDGTQWLKVESFLSTVFVPRLVGSTEAFTISEFDLPDGATNSGIPAAFTTTFGTGFDANGRFTAPVDGLYKFFLNHTSRVRYNDIGNAPP